MLRVDIVDGLNPLKRHVFSYTLPNGVVNSIKREAYEPPEATLSIPLDEFKRLCHDFGFVDNQTMVVRSWLYSNKKPRISKVIFNPPATIVLWSDRTKTVVKCQEGDLYSKRMGLALCIAKKTYGNSGNYNDIFKEWCEEDPSEEETKSLVDHIIENVKKRL